MFSRVKNFAEAERMKLRRANPQRRKAERSQSLASPLDGILSLHRSIGNRAMGTLLSNKESSPILGQPGPSKNLSGEAGSGMKKVELDEDEGVTTPALQKKEGGSGGPTTGPSTGPSSGPSSGPATAPAKAKQAGVKSFGVQWKKHPDAGAANPKLRLIFKAEFKNDADHDPALAEFRQNAGDKWEITAGPHKGSKGETVLRDDNYSRADDIKGNKLTDVNFVSNDNPGFDTGIDKDDVLDYSFTAEQMIIDTSQGNKVIEKRGPHTATIKGKHPRTFDGVPKTF